MVLFCFLHTARSKMRYLLQDLRNISATVHMGSNISHTFMASMCTGLTQWTKSCIQSKLSNWVRRKWVSHACRTNPETADKWGTCLWGHEIDHLYRRKDAPKWVIRIKFQCQVYHKYLNWSSACHKLHWYWSAMLQWRNSFSKWSMMNNIPPHTIYFFISRDGKTWQYEQCWDWLVNDLWYGHVVTSKNTQLLYKSSS